MRNSDPDAAVYWLARMVEAGEDPMYIARRLVRFASEDVGNADPQALVVAVAARDAAHFLGYPEANTGAGPGRHLPRHRARRATPSTPRTAPPPSPRSGTSASPVPLHLRNAPTKLMKQLDYGKGYHYAHDEPDAVADMDCLPDNLQGPHVLPPDRARIRKGDQAAAGRLEGAEAPPHESSPVPSARPAPPSDSFEVLLHFPARDAEHHGPAVRAHRRVPPSPAAPPGCAPSSPSSAGSSP